MLTLHEATLHGRAEQISLALHPGELLVLIGPNGAGKSSAMSLLAGLNHPDSGQVTLDDIPLTTLGPARLAAQRAVMEQQIRLPVGLDARAIIEMGAYRHGQMQAVDEALRLTCTEDLAPRDAETLSGGESQRVLLARALAQILTDQYHERYLLLDEPTAALDIGMADALLAQIHRIAHELNIGVLAILHDVNLALRHADRVGLMADGRLEAIGPTADIMQRGRLETLYGVRLAELMHADDPSLKAFIPLNR